MNPQLRRLQRAAGGLIGSQGLLSFGLPTAVSLAVHGGLVALLLTVTVRIATSPPRAAPIETPPVTLRSPAPNPAATASTQPGPTAPGSFAPQAAAAIENRSEVGTAAAPTLTLEQASRRAEALASATAERAQDAAKRDIGASFAASGATRGKRIVYVVDGSGPMIDCIGDVMAELRRSVGRLDPEQRFAVLLFRGREGQSSVSSPIDGGRALVAADQAAVERVTEWSRRVAAAGRSTPLAGLRRALALDPDVIFLLTRSITRTGGTGWGAGRAQILAELDRLNPRDPRTGRRRAVIKCVQFLEPDPTGVMRAIAQAHDPSLGRETMLTREQLRSPAPLDPPPPSLEPDRVSEAAGILARLSATGVDTEALLALSDAPATESPVAQPARRVLELIERDTSVLAGLLRSRARLLLHASGEPQDLAQLRRTLETLPTDDRDPQFEIDEAARFALLALVDLFEQRNPLVSAQNAGGADLADPLLRVEALAAAAAFDPTDNRLRALRSAAEPDALLRTLAARTAARALAARGRTEEALAALLELAPLPTGPDWERVGGWVNEIASGSVEAELDPRALLAVAQLSASGPQRDALFERAIQSATGRSRTEAAWSFARTLLDEASAPRAIEPLLLVYELEPASDRGALAVQTALSIALDQESGTADAAIVRALALGSPFPARQAWAKELVRLRFTREQIEPALDALEAHVLPASRDDASRAEAWNLARWGTQRRHASRATMTRVAEIAEALGFDSAVYRALAARAVESSDPATCAAELAELIPALGGLEMLDARLSLARSLAAVGSTERALAAIEPLLQLEPTGDRSDDPTTGEPQTSARFWESWALAMELAPMDAGERALRLAYLSSLDAELGGEPWASRLRRAARTQAETGGGE